MMVQTNNLCKNFGRFSALRGLTLNVPEGSAFALLGANGAGKTTTIKVLMNLLQPTAGSAVVLGVDSRRISPRELAQIGYVSENQQMPEGMTVAAYIRYLRPFYACPPNLHATVIPGRPASRYGVRERQASVAASGCRSQFDKRPAPLFERKRPGPGLSC